MRADDGSGETVLHVDGLTKTFGEGSDAVTAVEDLSLSVEHGEVVGVLGPNGAGKTTAIKSMLGLVSPDGGTVEACGVDVHDDPARAYRHVEAMLEGARNVYWRLTVRENLRFFAGLGGDRPADLTDRHDRLLAALDLQDAADTVVNELSRGMKQKVSLATTLVRDVDLVFLDEPTLGLDVEASIELRGELRRLAEVENVTIVLCSHDMDVIEAVCDRIVILQDGRVIADDAMSELVDVLHEKRYTVLASGPLGDGLGPELRERFGATIGDADSPTGDGGAVRIDATGLDADALAALLDRLREEDVTLLDVETAEPSLEDVFLRLTAVGDGSTGDDGGGPAPADAGRGAPDGAPGERTSSTPTEVSTDADG